MNTARKRSHIESALVNRFGEIFERHKRPAVETVSSGVAELNDAWQGFPRGAITEIYGDSSSGRTSLLISAVTAAAAQEETCALVDCSDTFDLSSAAKSGIDFNHLLWVRCGHNLERAFKAVDLVLHAGGFGLVALNLCDVPVKSARRIISSWWFRFRRAIEKTPTALLVLTPITAVRSCASVTLELKNEGTVWPSPLSLVSENSYSNFTGPGEGNYLSLVTPLEVQDRHHDALAHSHFLQTTKIGVNRQRPIEWPSADLKFATQRR
jgi:recA bacterial DNA recombination protein